MIIIIMNTIMNIIRVIIIIRQAMLEEMEEREAQEEKERILNSNEVKLLSFSPVCAYCLMLRKSVNTWV